MCTSVRALDMEHQPRLELYGRTVIGTIFTIVGLDLSRLQDYFDLW